jgi:hypothetical protein
MEEQIIKNKADNFFKSEVTAPKNNLKMLSLIVVALITTYAYDLAKTFIFLNLL